jgi:hypothetical protein
LSRSVKWQLHYPVKYLHETPRHRRLLPAGRIIARIGVDGIFPVNRAQPAFRQLENKSLLGHESYAVEIRFPG